MSMLPDNYKLILAGNRSTIGEDKYKEKIMKLIKNDKCIEDIGEVKDQSEFFEKIDCLVLPSVSRLESFGMVSAEAINYGIPVVASDIAGIRVPVVVSGMGEVFDPKSAADLAEKIKLATTKSYRSKIKFLIKDTIKKYEQIFN